MAQVRVGGSIAHAYSFLFTRLLSIIGFSWLPCIFLAVLSSWWLTRLSTSALLVATGAGPAPRMIAEALAFALVALLLVSTIAVPLSRLALGEEIEGAAARFAIGARELKLFLALLRFSAIVVAALMILIVGLAALVEAGLIHAIAGVLPGRARFSSESGDLWLGLPIRGLVVAAFAALTIAIVAILTARLGLFLVPVAAVEDTPSLSRAAALSRGNTWRLLIVSAALSVPVLLLLITFEFLVLGPPVRANLLHALSDGMPDRVLEILASHGPAIGAVASISAAAFLSLISGATAAAYGDRREDVPVRAAAERREPRDTSDYRVPISETGRAPAFAKIHPLATLLPSETANAAPHGETVAQESAEEPLTPLADSRNAMRESESAPQMSADEEFSLPAQPTAAPDAVPAPGEANDVLGGEKHIRAARIDENQPVDENAVVATDEVAAAHDDPPADR